MADLSYELEGNLLKMLNELENFEGSSEERGDLVDDISKLYKVHLEERKLDDEREVHCDESLDEIRRRREARFEIARDISIVVIKGAIAMFGYYVVGRMHANSIAADSYGTLQRSASFRIIPSINPQKDL